MLKQLVGKAQTAIYLIRQWRHSADYMINNETFWDQYVRVWERTEAHQRTFLGDEWTYDGKFTELLARHASKEKTALEIGSGGGRILAQAVGLFRHVHACDISSQMLRKARESVPASNVSFHKIDGFTLQPFGAGSIDVVYSHDVFVHFSSMQVYPYFAEIKRVLRDGGEAVVSFRSFTVHFDMFKSHAMDLWQRKRFPPHIRNHFVTEEMIRTMLADLGLEVVEIEKENFLIAVFRKPTAAA